MFVQNKRLTVLQPTDYNFWHKCFTILQKKQQQPGATSSTFTYITTNILNNIYDRHVFCILQTRPRQRHRGCTGAGYLPLCQLLR